MKPNTKFDFNVAELEIVESAMKYRMSRLLARSKTVVKESSRVKIDAEIKHIYTLLGKIHNQKNWYVPPNGKPYVSGLRMRYLLGQCEYKWNHAHKSMEHIWIRRELGDELYKTVESNNWEWHLLRSSSTSLPGDMYCRCDIYVEIPDSKQATLFALKYNITTVEKIT